MSLSHAQPRFSDTVFAPPPVPSRTPLLQAEDGAVCVPLPYALVLALGDYLRDAAARPQPSLKARSTLRQAMAVIDAVPVWPTDPIGQPVRLLNRYACGCGERWSDAWSAICDDDCPACGLTCRPVDSVDIAPRG